MTVTRTFVNHCVAEYNAGRCVQLHGGYGHMLEYPVARAWLDGRVPTIYDGTTEIMADVRVLAQKAAGNRGAPGCPRWARMNPLPSFPRSPQEPGWPPT